MIFPPYNMVGPCASTTSFRHPPLLYGGVLSPDVRFFALNMNFVSMLGPCAPCALKKAPFCKNLFLYHFPSFFSIVIKEQPILFVRKWAQWYVRPGFLWQCWKKWSVHIPAFFVTSRNNKNDMMGTMGNERLAMAAKKNMQSMNSLQNDHQNQPSDSLQNEKP